MSISKAIEFDEIAGNVFAPIYPVLARQIVRRTGIKNGKCLDIGSGGGHLGLALAKMTELEITLFDLSPEALSLAEVRIREDNLIKRVRTQLGDVRQMPFAENAFALIVSRGSVWFWENQRAAFYEIMRVLIPGGKAYIGGGFGTKALRQQIAAVMNRREAGWEERIKGYRGNHTPATFAVTLQQVGIDDFRIIDDESGFWMVFSKPVECNVKR